MRKIILLLLTTIFAVMFVAMVSSASIEFNRDYILIGQKDIGLKIIFEEECDSFEILVDDDRLFDEKIRGKEIEHRNAGYTLKRSIEIKDDIEPGVYSVDSTLRYVRTSDKVAISKNYSTDLEVKKSYDIVDISEPSYFGDNISFTMITHTSMNLEVEFYCSMGLVPENMVVESYLTPGKHYTFSSRINKDEQNRFPEKDEITLILEFSDDDGGFLFGDQIVVEPSLRARPTNPSEDTDPGVNPEYKKNDITMLMVVLVLVSIITFNYMYYIRRSNSD